MIQAELRLVEVFPIAGRSVQLHERQLDLLVAWGVMAPVGTEHLADQIGAHDRDVQQAPFPGRLEMCDRRFVHMTLVVQLVAGAEPRPSLGAGAGRRVFGIDRAGRVQVAVRLLRGRDDGDQIVELLVERRIRDRRERVRRRLDDLVDVGVVVTLPVVRACDRVGGVQKVRDAPGLLVLPHDVRDRHGPIRVQARPPEGVRDPHGCGRHGPNGVLAWRQRRCADAAGRD